MALNPPRNERAEVRGRDRVSSDRKLLLDTVL
jgi:hypothetical protein